MRKLYSVLIALGAVTTARAQGPTSLQYPSSNVYVSQTTTVYLAPTVSGNVTGYSISPDITANTGLSFNTNTGVISGVPTQGSAQTSYTVTASNASGSTANTFSIQVFSYNYNNANGQVSFLDANRSFKVGNGQGVGDVALYTNVATIGGQAIDCIIRTREANNVNGAWASYDQPAVNGPSNVWTNNSDNFFSPQLSFLTGGGNVRFEFQFILGGSFNTTNNTGTNVTLQNVQLNTYDIDGNSTSGGNGSNQFNGFGGFATYELASTSSNITPLYNAGTGLTRFRSNTDVNTANILDPVNRIRVTYNTLSNFSINVGAEASGSAYFFLDFSSGGAFTTNPVSAPSIDLNTASSGVNNGGSGCAALLAFTGGTGQTNAGSGSTLSEFTLRFPTASVVNGASETLVINGATGGSTIPLNFANGASITAVSLGGVTYNISATVAGGESALSFVSSTGSFTLAQFETFLDSMRYQNIAASPANGDRSFTVNVRNTVAKSPDAVFTATLNCVSVSGNVYHDANGLNDATVNASGSVTGFAVPMYAVLVDNATNLAALPSLTIAAGSSAFNFGNVTPGKYNLYFQTSAVAQGANIIASSYPSVSAPYAASYYSTGENLGAGAGNDGSVNGRLVVTVGSINAANANLGLQLPPNATATGQASSLNPGGFNYRTLTGSNFGTADADGSISFIRITAFPTGANALRVGSTVYTNGGTCPPQSTCNPWPGTLDVAYSGGGPTSAIAVDPTADGATSVAVSYRAVDNGGGLSTANPTINVPFTASPAITISGNAWIDANGNGVNNGSGAGEPYTAAASAGQTLYALLVQTTNTYSGNPTVLTSTPVTAAAAGYSFSDVPSGNDYEVRIVSLAAQPAAGAALSAVSLGLATNYRTVSTVNNTTVVAALNTTTPAIVLGNVTASQANVSFGLDQLPTAGGYTATAQANPGSTATVPVPVAAFSGTDPEDGTYAGNLSGRTVTLVPGANANLFYTGIGAIPVGGSAIAGFNPALLSIDPAGTGTGAVTASFTYTVTDNAGVPSAPATVTLGFDAAAGLSGTVFRDANGNAVIDGADAGINAGGLNAVLTDASGNVIEVAAVGGNGAYTLAKAARSASYLIVLSTASPAPGSVLTVSSLPAPANGDYVNTGVNPGSASPNTGNKTGILSVSTPASGPLADRNFGIEQRPVADAKAMSAAASSFAYNASVVVNGQAAYGINAGSASLSGATVKSLSGTDVEDCNTSSSCNSNRSFRIVSINANTALYYGASPVLVTAGNLITNFDVSLLTIYGALGQGLGAGNALGFTYNLVDAAGVASANVSYSLQSTGTALPVTLISFDAEQRGKAAQLRWQVGHESGLAAYAVQRSADGQVWKSIGRVAATGASGYSLDDAAPLTGSNYYRLEMQELDGSSSYSPIARLSFGGDGSIRVLPNPVTDRLIVEAGSGTGTVTVLNALGAVQLQAELNGSVQIDVSGLPSGSYLVRVSTGEGTAVFRVVKR